MALSARRHAHVTSHLGVFPNPHPAFIVIGYQFYDVCAIMITNQEFILSHTSVSLPNPPHVCNTPTDTDGDGALPAFELLCDDYLFIPSFELPLGSGQRLVKKKKGQGELSVFASPPSISNTLTVLPLPHITYFVRQKRHRCALRSPVLGPNPSPSHPRWYSPSSLVFSFSTPLSTIYHKIEG